MSDTPSLAERMYPGGPATGGPNAALIDGGKVGTAATPAPASPAPAPDTAPKTLAGIFYGTDGPKNEPGGPRGISDGVAKPAAQPESVGSTHPAASKAADQPAPAQAFDPAKLSVPEGMQVDEAALAEFGAVARDLKLDHVGAEKLVAMHTKAMQARDQAFTQAVDGWASETRQHYGANLPQVSANIRDAIGSDADAQEFMRLMDWSGLGNHPAILRTLERLARR